MASFRFGQVVNGMMDVIGGVFMLMFVFCDADAILKVVCAALVLSLSILCIVATDRRPSY